MKKSFWTFLGWPLLVVPIVIGSIGALLNQLVIAANKGMFPVLVPNCPIQTTDIEIHSCMTSASHLKFLADWLNFHDGVYSPGDLLQMLADSIQGPCFWIWLSLIVWMAYQYKKSTATK